MIRDKTKLELAKEELIELVIVWILVILFLFISIIWIAFPIPKINLDRNLYLGPIIVIQTFIIILLHFHQNIIRSSLFPIFYLILNLVIGYLTLWSLRDYYRIKKENY